jgi:SAM-dependent methyltransferase
MNCPRCHDPSPQEILHQFNHKDYGHLFCSKCGISFDSNVSEVLKRYARLENPRITDFSEDEYRELFIESSDITDGTDNIYTEFNWDSQDELKMGIISHITTQIDEAYSPQDKISILDVGCGDGFTTILLSKAYPNANFVAMDPSPSINKLRGESRIKVYQSVLQNTDFAESSFDIVIILGNLMLHADPFDTLQLAKRLLVDGGLLLFDFKNINCSSRVLAKNLGFIGNRALNKKNFIQRNFSNMRYGLSRGYMLDFCESIGLLVKNSYSKPPRLLEFGNKSQHTRGLSGVVWRLLNTVDQARDEMAWLQFTCIKKD